MAAPGTIGHIRREALCGQQAGPFSNEEHHDGRSEQLANIVQHPDTAIADGKGPAKAPATFFRTGMEQRQ